MTRGARSLSAGAKSGAYSSVSPHPATRRILPGSPFNTGVAPVSLEHFDVDDRVSHDRYGLGTVVEVQGPEVVLVAFGSEVRRLALPNLRLVKL